MTIECIKIKDLLDWTTSTRFENAEVIPISRHRALSHVNNPRAKANDIALVLIFEETTLLGYLGILPDQMIKNGACHRAAWMSCIWVNPKARGKGVAKQLLKTGFEVWDNKLLATEFTAPAKNLYDKMDLFEDLKIKPGMRAYLRMNMATLLPKKNPKYKAFRFALHLSDGLFNLLNGIRLAFYKHTLPSHLVLQNIAEIDEEAWQFIQAQQKDELFQRSKEDLNWVLKYPWLLSTEEAKQDGARYHFSSFEKDFKFVALKIYDAQQLIAVMLLVKRGEALKIPYLFLDKKNIKSIAKVIIDFMYKNQICILTTYDQFLVHYFQNNRTPFFAKRPFKRHYLLSKSFENSIKKQPIVIQDGDGDCAFT